MMTTNFVVVVVVVVVAMTTKVVVEVTILSTVSHLSSLSGHNIRPRNCTRDDMGLKIF